MLLHEVVFVLLLAPSVLILTRLLLKVVVPLLFPLAELVLILFVILVPTDWVTSVLLEIAVVMAIDGWAVMQSTSKAAWKYLVGGFWRQFDNISNGELTLLNNVCHVCGRSSNPL